MSKMESSIWSAMTFWFVVLKLAGPLVAWSWWWFFLPSVPLFVELVKLILR